VSEATAAETITAPTAEPEPEPEAEPVDAGPPPKPNNADLNVTITFADRTRKSGHVIRVERAIDWYGEDGWSMDTSDLTIAAESSTAYEKLSWEDVRSVSVQAGSIPGDVNCFYDSNWSPWMYECTLTTTSTLTDTSGGRWTVDNRHKWRLTFEDGTEVEFWLKKHCARQQDAEVVDLHSGNPENYALYTTLQDQIRADARGGMVVSVRVQ